MSVLHAHGHDSFSQHWLKFVSCLCAGGGAPAPEQSVPMRLAAGLRYGENPHQPAAAYLDASLAEVGRGGIGTAIQHHGKEACAMLNEARS